METGATALEGPVMALGLGCCKLGVILPSGESSFSTGN